MPISLSETEAEADAANAVAAAWVRDNIAQDVGLESTYVGDLAVTLEEPRHVTVSERLAYVVVPVGVRWLQDGTPVERTGSMTMALREEAGGWRISACAWTWN